MSPMKRTANAASPEGTGGATPDPVRAWLATHTPIAPHLLEGPEFAATVRERRRAVGAADDSAYVRRLAADPDEAIRIQTAIAVPESWIFRYRASFEWLRGHLAERLAAGRSTLRMLCAPCARGQEAYSLAATAVAAGYAPGSFTLEAVDLAEPHLEVARTGTCAIGELREGMPEWAGPSFVVRSGTLALERALLARITFLRGDLLQEALAPGDGRFDVIACRNLLIYLSDPARQRLIDRLERWLAPTGVILLGHADAVRSLTATFEPMNHAAFAWRRRALDARHLAERSSPRRTTDVVEPSEPSRRPPRDRVVDRSKRPRAGAARPVGAPADVPDQSPPPSSVPPSTGSSVGPTSGLLEQSPASLASESLRDALVRRDEAAIRSSAERLLRLRPEAVEAHVALAEILAPREPRAAESHLRRALYLEPASETALIALAAILERDGRTTEADRLRTRAMRAHLGRTDIERAEREDRPRQRRSSVADDGSTSVAT